MLVPAWIVRVHVPVGASRRRPLAHVRAVLEVIQRHPRAGLLGDYEGVVHLSLAREHFARSGGAPSRWTAVTITTYLTEATRAELDTFARELAAAHPWEHPVIDCTGPEGAFVWMPE